MKTNRDESVKSHELANEYHYLYELTLAKLTMAQDIDEQTKEMREAHATLKSDLKQQARGEFAEAQICSIRGCRD